MLLSISDSPFNGNESQDMYVSSHVYILHYIYIYIARILTLTTSNNFIGGCHICLIYFPDKSSFIYYIHTTFNFMSFISDNTSD